MKRQIPVKIACCLRDWVIHAAFLRIVHVVLGITATICSLLVAVKINSWPKNLLEWLSLTAAVCVGLLSAFDLGAKANRVRGAWRKLHAATIRFEEDKDYSLKDLVTVYDKAEEIYGDVREKPV